MADYMYEEREDLEGKKGGISGAPFEGGKTEESLNWREKLDTREDILKYLRSALRYWYSKEWYGSEKRKQEI